MPHNLGHQVRAIFVCSLVAALHIAVGATESLIDKPTTINLSSLEHWKSRSFKKGEIAQKANGIVLADEQEAVDNILALPTPICAEEFLLKFELQLSGANTANSGASLTVMAMNELDLDKISEENQLWTLDFDTFHDTWLPKELEPNANHVSIDTWMTKSPSNFSVLLGTNHPEKKLAWGRATVNTVPFNMLDSGFFTVTLHLKNNNVTLVLDGKESDPYIINGAVFREGNKPFYLLFRSLTGAAKATHVLRNVNLHVVEGGTCELPRLTKPQIYAKLQTQCPSYSSSSDTCPTTCVKKTLHELIEKKNIAFVDYDSILEDCLGANLSAKAAKDKQAEQAEKERQTQAAQRRADQERAARQTEAEARKKQDTQQRARELAEQKKSEQLEQQRQEELARKRKEEERKSQQVTLDQKRREEEAKRAERERAQRAAKRKRDAALVAYFAKDTPAVAETVSDEERRRREAYAERQAELEREEKAEEARRKAAALLAAVSSTSDERQSDKGPRQISPEEARRRMAEVLSQQAAEKERERQERLAEEKRKEAQKQAQEESRRAEEQRQREAEQKEEQRQRAAEQQRQAEELRKQAEDAKRAAERTAEQKRQEEALRLAEQRRQAEAERVETQRRQEQNRLEAQKARQQETQRQKEEELKRAAELAAEAIRRADERRKREAEEAAKKRESERLVEYFKQQASDRPKAAEKPKRLPVQCSQERPIFERSILRARQTIEDIRLALNRFGEKGLQNPKEAYSASNNPTWGEALKKERQRLSTLEERVKNLPPACPSTP